MSLIGGTSNLCDVHHKASRGNTCSINFRKRNSLNIVFWEKPTLRRLMTKMDKIIYIYIYIYYILYIYILYIIYIYIYIYILYVKYIYNNSYKNVFFIFLFLQYLNSETPWKWLGRKTNCHFFTSSKVLDSFSISTHSTELIVSLQLNMLLQYSIYFI